MSPGNGTPVLQLRSQPACPSAPRAVPSPLRLRDRDVLGLGDPSRVRGAGQSPQARQPRTRAGQGRGQGPARQPAFAVGGEL